MQPGLSEVASEVDADPAAVFEAHDAESIGELLASDGNEAARGPSAASLADLFEGELSRPERRAVAADADAAGADAAGAAGESATTPAVLGDLERAMAAEEPEASSEALESVDDGDVADALAAAEELEDDDASVSVPEEWLREP